MTLTPYIDRLAQGAVLTEQESFDAIALMMQGCVNDADMTRFLTLLADRGESVDELAGAARALRAHALRVDAPPGAIDCCGTGGDGLHTLNISTAVAFVVAGCGVPVAKHGNRAASSKSGAADVLEALGVPLTLTPEQAAKALREIGFCFLMAPYFHPAMRHVAGVRRAIGRRTIFNLLGPLVNPAAIRRQLVGVPGAQWLDPMAQALGRLGSEAAWVVHGHGGMDELSPSGPTQITQLAVGGIGSHTIDPGDAGLPLFPADSLRGGDADHNAAALRALLERAPEGPYRDCVLLNAAAALMVAGKAGSLRTGRILAEDSLRNGSAFKVLQQYSDFLHEVVA